MPPSTSSKTFLKEFSLFRLYAVLLLSFSYFILQMAIAHVAHSLILQVDAYHMLYNMLALLTSVITTKMCRKGSNVKNTFGWTRIDVCGAIASLCFLAALCFSVVIEALQTMLHVSHHEKMHFPVWVGAVGIVGLAVNGASCLIIGGYTHHQKGFLGSHRSGQDIVISPSARRGPDNPKISCGGPFDTFRDFFGCFLVITCAVIVYFWTDNWTDFVDPCFTILEVLILGISSYKYAKEAGYILLLTIPDNIDVKTLLNELYKSFPEIKDIHEFHIWQLNPARIIATAHVVLQNTKDCWAVQNNIIDFLQTKGISQVTLQPEFLEVNNAGVSPQTLKRRQCFLPCREAGDCYEKKCCVTEDELHSVSSPCEGGGHGHSHGRSQSLKSFKDLDNDDQVAGHSHSHGVKHMKSNPELNKQSKGSPNPDVVELHSHDPHSTTPNVVIKGESSDDDEDESKQELKPMI